MKPSGFLLILVAIGVFVAGSVTGFNLLTSSATTTVAAPTCTPRTIETGDDVTANLITVNIYNASRTAGLANRISILLQRRGFLAGTVANNPTEIETSDIVILTSDKSDPRVIVISQQFSGKVSYEEPPPGTDIDNDNDNVSVLVGSKYASKGLRKKGEDASATADRSITVCLPVLPVS